MSDIWKKAQELREQKLVEARRRITWDDIKPGAKLMHTGRYTHEPVEIIEVLKERSMSSSMATMVRVRSLTTGKTFDTEVNRIRGPFDADEEKLLRRAADENPCWDGYEQVGMKDQDGKKVPNCVPKKTAAILDPWEFTRKVTEAVWDIAEKLPDAGVSMSPNRVLVPGGARSPEGWFSITWRQDNVMGYAVMEIVVKPFDLERGECSIEGFVDSGKRNVFTVVASPDTVDRMVKTELARAWKQAKKDLEAILAKRQKKAQADAVFEIGQTHEGLVMSLRVTMSLPAKEMPYNQWHNSLLGAYGKVVRRWKTAERNGADRMPSLHSGEWTIWTHGGATHVGWEGYFDEGMEISDLRAFGLLG